jgi:hypothetical protein
MIQPEFAQLTAKAISKSQNMLLIYRLHYRIQLQKKAIAFAF